MQEARVVGRRRHVAGDGVDAAVLEERERFRRRRGRLIGEIRHTLFEKLPVGVRGGYTFRRAALAYEERHVVLVVGRREAQALFLRVDVVDDHAAEDVRLAAREDVRRRLLVAGRHVGEAEARELRDALEQADGDAIHLAVAQVGERCVINGERDALRRQRSDEVFLTVADEDVVAVPFRLGDALERAHKGIVVEQDVAHGLIEARGELGLLRRDGEIHRLRGELGDGGELLRLARVGGRGEVDVARAQRREQVAAVAVARDAEAQAVLRRPLVECLRVRGLLAHADARAVHSRDIAVDISLIAGARDDADARRGHRVEGEEHLLLPFGRLEHGRQEVDAARSDVGDGLRPVRVGDELVVPARVAGDLVEIEGVVAAVVAVLVPVEQAAGGGVADAHLRMRRRRGVLGGRGRRREQADERAEREQEGAIAETLFHRASFLSCSCRAPSVGRIT